MTPFWSDYSHLLLRPQVTLTEQELDSLRYLKAFNDDFLGLGGTSERRWCAMAREVRALVRDLGRMPADGDAGFTPAKRSWIAELRCDQLCPFQRAALECSEFWEWPRKSDLGEVDG